MDKLVEREAYIDAFVAALVASQPAGVSLGTDDYAKFRRDIAEQEDGRRLIDGLMANFSLPSSIQALEAELAGVREALTPSGDTKAAYHGEFAFDIPDTFFDEDAEEFLEHSRKVYVPWTTVKEIMRAILHRGEVGGSPEIASLSETS